MGHGLEDCLNWRDCSLFGTAAIDMIDTRDRCTRTTYSILLARYFLLDSCIDLVDHIISRPRIPRITSLRYDAFDACRVKLQRPLKEIHRESHTRVPRYMAMVGPDAWIVGIDLDHQVPVAPQHVDVTAQRITHVNAYMSVPGPITFSDDILHGRRG